MKIQRNIWFITVFLVSVLLLLNFAFSQEGIDDSSVSTKDAKTSTVNTGEVAIDNSLDSQEISEIVGDVQGALPETTSITYETVGTEGLQGISLKTSSDGAEIKGYTLNNINYALQVIACDHSSKVCSLRINDVPHLINPGNEIDIDKEYKILIKEIVLNSCEKRFCDMYFDVYDTVEMKIERNNLI